MSKKRQKLDDWQQEYKENAVGEKLPDHKPAQGCWHDGMSFSEIYVAWKKRKRNGKK